MKNFAYLTMLLLLALFFSPLALAATLQPLDTIKKPIDQTILILNDAKYKDKSLRDEQQEKIWNTMKGLFDNTEVSKRTLSRNWKKFSESEKKEFSDIFVQFIGETFIDKIQGEYQNQRIIYVNQEILKEKWAIARTKVVKEGVETPVDFRMKLIDGEWKAYDIYVEGVSLVRNYQTQFMKILMKETPAQLIQRLKDKMKARNPK